MKTKPRLRAPYDRLDNLGIELRTPGYKASGLHIHYNYNLATIWLFHLIVEYRLSALTIMGRIVSSNKQKQLKI